ncbi:MAG TPA: hypothetical protein VGN66_18020 [Sphingomonas sp.]|jgi:ABC-type Fe3+ transport system substrate-binding protein|nr:hypothetical protein [Sphingomonas sp.]
MKSEGANSPADLFITADAGALWRAQQAGLFQPVQSETLTARIPAICANPAVTGTASCAARASPPSPRGSRRPSR